MADYQLRARIPQELADRLFQVIKDLQEQTDIADVTTSSVTRAAIETFIKDHEGKKSRKSIKIEIDNSKVNNEDLQTIGNEIAELSKNAKYDGLRYAYDCIRRKILVEQIDRSMQ